MGGDRVACEGAHDFPVTADDHVRDEGEFRRFCREQHVAVDRVVLKIAGPRIRALDEFRTVVGQHRPARGDSGQDAFAAA